VACALCGSGIGLRRRGVLCDGGGVRGVEVWFVDVVMSFASL